MTFTYYTKHKLRINFVYRMHCYKNSSHLISISFIRSNAEKIDKIYGCKTWMDRISTIIIFDCHHHYCQRFFFFITFHFVYVCLFFVVFTEKWNAYTRETFVQKMYWKWLSPKKYGRIQNVLKWNIRLYLGLGTFCLSCKVKKNVTAFLFFFVLSVFNGTGNNILMFWQTSSSGF